MKATAGNAWKRAQVVTDCVNGACGMERKETTGAVGC